MVILEDSEESVFSKDAGEESVPWNFRVRRKGC